MNKYKSGLKAGRAALVANVRKNAMINQIDNKRTSDSAQGEGQRSMAIHFPLLVEKSMLRTCMFSPSGCKYSQGSFKGIPYVLSFLS